MQLFSQRDPRWGSLILTPGSQDMAHIGCVVTSLAMLSDYFKPTRTPADILKLLRFVPGGKILWDSVNFENWQFDWRGYGRNDDAIQFHIKDPDHAVILNVANGSHWVVATGKTLLGGVYKIADPWTGDQATMARYRNDITGAAYFRRK